MKRPSAKEPELRDDPENCVFNRLLQSPDPVVVYGAGYCAESIGNAMLEAGRPVDAYCVDDEFHKPGTFVCGMPVQRFSTCLNSFQKVTLAVGFGTAHPDWSRLWHHPKIQTAFGNIGLARGLPFTKQYVDTQWQAICELYTQLGDDTSRESLNNYINSRLFGHSHDLAGMQTTHNMFSEPALDLRNTDVYCDCGAYDGDTIQQFLSVSPAIKKIYAWEPDNNNVNRLQEFLRRAGTPKTTVIQKCVGHTPGVVRFSAVGTKVSTIGTEGDITEVDTIDNLCPDTTILKIDIEGEESSAIEGARHSIAEQQTRVITAIYHRRDDLTTLATALLNLRPRSRLLIRWQRDVPDDVMLYAV